ncbi:hypothetical protein Leryth_024533 [Lithospermum erythrorhizon]|nr:hypothetical protein Leryth_024533 [Lithospermum erythrorhizon]
MMEGGEAAGSSLDALMSSFNTRIAHLQQLVIARNMYPASSMADLSEIDAALQGMEMQVTKIKERLKEETEAIPKAKKLIEASLHQQKILQNMSLYVPASLPEKTVSRHVDVSRSFPSTPSEIGKEGLLPELVRFEDPAPKERKGRAPAPVWYISAEELNALPSYMKGRLTLDKVNAAINDMATYAETNAQLIAAPRNKLSENLLDKSLELRNISAAESLKGKYFFLESDIKGPSLKLDATGKAILTVLRHVGRISETRSGRHRVFILSRP